jgi:hypothetical protein
VDGELKATNIKAGEVNGATRHSPITVAENKAWMTGETSEAKFFNHIPSLLHYFIEALQSPGLTVEGLLLTTWCSGLRLAKMFSESSYLFLSEWVS